MGRKKSTLFIIILIVSLALSACGGDNNNPNNQVNNTSESTETLIPPTPAPPELESGWYIYTDSNNVHDMAYAEGFIYTAGPGGVVAWDVADGSYTKFTTLDGMSHISVSAIETCNMPDLKIVVGHETGIDLYDPATDAWERLSISNEDSTLDGQDVDTLLCDEENGRLLIGYSGLGIYDFNSGAFTRYTSEDGLSWDTQKDILVNGDDVWVASGYNGVSQINSNGITIYNEEGGMPSERALSFASSEDGTIWIGTSKGLIKYNANQWTLYNSENSDVPNEISTITAAADGTLWLTTNLSGAGRVCQFDPVAENCAYTYENNDRGINSLILLDDGRIAFSTFSGLHLFDSGAESDTADVWLVEEDQLASNFVDSFALDSNGLLWVGTDGGMNLIDPSPSATTETWQTYRADYNDPNSPGGNWASNLVAQDNGEMWVVITNGSLSFFDGTANWTVYEDYYSVTDVAVDDEGRLWVADDDAPIALLKDGVVVGEMTPADGLPEGYIHALYQDGDALWIGGKELVRYSGGAIEMILTEEDLDEEKVSALTTDANGDLLIATYHAIMRYDGSTLTVLLQGEYESELLSSFTSISGVAAGQNGEIYLSTYDGLLLSLDNGATWAKLTTDDGLTTDNLNSLYVDQYNTLWIGGGSSNIGGGLMRYVP